MASETGKAPKYWRDTQTHKLAQAASNALFDLHHYMHALGEEDWREVYGWRCKLGQIEQRLSFRAGYKDGHLTAPPEPTETTK